MVARVPMTPMCPECEVCVASWDAGVMTPRTGMSKVCRKASMAWALAVLQAMTMVLTFLATSCLAHEVAYRMMVCGVRFP